MAGILAYVAVSSLVAHFLALLNGSLSAGIAGAALLCGVIAGIAVHLKTKNPLPPIAAGRASSETLRSAYRPESRRTPRTTNCCQP